MDVPRELTAHVPDLRCFACGVCGSSERGDEYVSRMMEEINASLVCFPTELNPKVGLYQFFMGSLPPIALTQAANAVELTEVRNISLLTPPSRHAFLLYVVEGFSLQEMASILSLSIAEAESLVAEANQEIAALVATDVLIIEDEPLIAMDIASIACDLGHQVIGIASTHKEATALANKKRPGLIVSDIQLADGSCGITAVAEILEDVDAPVIFMTGSNLRPPKVKRLEPSFFLRKPYKEDAVSAMINQALLFEGKALQPISGLA